MTTVRRPLVDNGPKAAQLPLELVYAELDRRGSDVESHLSELLDEFRTGDGVNLIRESVRMVMQELIETEATEQIGAGRCERTEARTTERNGSEASSLR